MRRTSRHVIEKDWREMVSFVRRFCFSLLVALAVLTAPTIYLGFKLEARLRDRESQEKPWVFARRLANGEAIGPLTKGRTRVAPLATRNISYLPVPQGPAWGYTARSEYSVSKSEDRYRIVETGDSFSGGSDGFCHWIETILNDLSTTGKSVEVIRLAIEGYNTSDSYGVIRHLALDLNPDEILYQRYTNDVKYTTYETFSHADLYAQECRNVKRPFGVKTRFWLESEVALYKELTRRKDLFWYDHAYPLTVPIANVPVLGWLFNHAFPALEPCLKVITDYDYDRLVMHEMAELTRRGHVRFGILWVTPFPAYGVPTGRDELFEEVRGQNPDVSMSYPRNHLEPRIADFGLPKEVLFNRPFPIADLPQDTHPSLLAHRLLAEAYIEDVLLQRSQLREHLGVDIANVRLASRQYYVSLIPETVRAHYRIE